MVVLAPDEYQNNTRLMLASVFTFECVYRRGSTHVPAENRSATAVRLNANAFVLPKLGRLGQCRLVR